MGLACLAISASAAFSAEAEEDAPAKPAVPNIYLDLRTTYATIPAGTLGLGFGNTSVSAALGALAVRRGAAPSNGLPAAKSIAVDLPLTVDVNDRVSLYGGVSGSTTDIGGGWSTFDVTSWNIGVQADLYRQNGGSIPTITLQSTLTQSVPNDQGMTNSFNNILEFDYALDEDETRGWLAGVQYTTPTIASPFASIRPNTILYAGGYYQLAEQLEVHRAPRHAVVRRGAARGPDAGGVFHAADPAARPRSHGRQRQPPVRHHRADRLDAEAVLPGDPANAALCDPQLTGIMVDRW
ncbi:hypothetical protein ABH975_007789 [Bradyrhizobium ottawaense]